MSKKDNVAHFFQCSEVSKCATDHAATDKCYLGSGHEYDLRSVDFGRMRNPNIPFVQECRAAAWRSACTELRDAIALKHSFSSGLRISYARGT